MSSSSGNLGSVQLNPNSQHLHINILSGSHTNFQLPQPLNLPRQDLLDESRSQEYLEICYPLQQASSTGDWEVAKEILDKRKELVRFSINKTNETPLHIASFRGNALFVEDLVKMMEKEDLELRNNNSNTALCLAVAAGHVEVAQILVAKHKDLRYMVGSQENTPLYMAAISGIPSMVDFFYQNSERMIGGPWTDEYRGSVLLACVEAELFDVALQIVGDHPDVVVSTGGTILQVLARKPGALRKKQNFLQRHGLDSITRKLYIRNLELVDEETQAMLLLQCIWKRIVKLPKAEIDDILRGPINKIMQDKDQKTFEKEASIKYSSRLLFIAAEIGNTAFIVELIRHYPELVLELNESKQTIFHVAVSYRRNGVLSMLHDIGSIKDSVLHVEDQDGNNMLHLVGIPKKKSTINHIYESEGPVLQMQREISWFKEVCSILPSSLREKKNGDGQTPHELFIKNHHKLLDDGVEWIKRASSDLMVVAVLIVGITFAATITFGGGNDQETGKPILSKNMNFNLFYIVNGLSFLSASSSIFFLLSISSSHRSGGFLLSISSFHPGGYVLMPLVWRFTFAVLLLCQAMMLMTAAFSNNFRVLIPKKYQFTEPIIRILSMIVLVMYMSLLSSHYFFLARSALKQGKLLIHRERIRFQKKYPRNKL